MQVILIIALILVPVLPVYNLQEDVDPFEVINSLDRFAGRQLWPGFDPSKIPIAIYDGEKTLLFRHPQPPEGFVKSGEHEDLWIHEGRHAKMVANTSVELGEVRTATIMLNMAKGKTVEEIAAVAAHEAFHVFQNQNHSDWMANTANQFVYPMDDAANYASLILEAKALARAMDAEEAEVSARWAAKVMALRTERYPSLSEVSLKYERGIELMEGTAHYVEYTALGKATDTEGLRKVYKPEQIRHRLYATGRALAVLLDRHSPGWKERLEAGPVRPLDLLLSDALSEVNSTPANFSAEEITEARKDADAAVKKLLAERKRCREEFLDAKGWSVVVEAAEGQPLWPQGFDPLNLMYLGGKEVLHNRWLKLGNSAGAFSMLDHKALTFAAGEHPLFNGVSKAIIAGLVSEPAVSEQDGQVKVETEGYNLEFSGATIKREGKVITVVLSK